GPAGLQNQCGRAAHGSVGSTPAPLRSTKSVVFAGSSWTSGGMRLSPRTSALVGSDPPGGTVDCRATVARRGYGRRHGPARGHRNPAQQALPIARRRVVQLQADLSGERVERAGPEAPQEDVFDALGGEGVARRGADGNPPRDDARAESVDPSRRGASVA